MLWLWILGAVWSAYQFLATGAPGWALVFVGDLLFIAYRWRNRATGSKVLVPHHETRDQPANQPRGDRSSWLMVAFFVVGAAVVLPPLAGMVRQLGDSGRPWLAAVPILLLGLTAFNGVMFFRNRQGLGPSPGGHDTDHATGSGGGATPWKGLIIHLVVICVLGFAMLAWLGTHQEQIAEDLVERSSK